MINGPRKACAKMSTTFLLSSSSTGQFGYMEDEVFHVGAAAYYLGQLCPLMSQVVGYANLANVGSNSICMVCTLLQCLSTWARTSRFHNKLQSITQTMMKLRLRGIHSAAEVVGHPCIASYVNHPSSHLNAQKAPHLIVPDTHSTFRLYHLSSAADAFFEIKYFTACKSQYDHNKNADLWPVDWCALLSYDQRFKKLNSLFDSP